MHIKSSSHLYQIQQRVKFVLSDRNLCLIEVSGLKCKFCIFFPSLIFSRFFFIVSISQNFCKDVIFIQNGIYGEKRYFSRLLFLWRLGGWEGGEVGTLFNTIQPFILLNLNVSVYEFLPRKLIGFVCIGTCCLNITALLKSGYDLAIFSWYVAPTACL